MTMRRGGGKARWHSLSWRIWGRVLAGFLAAILGTAILGSVVQAQFNLAAIAGLGAEIPPGLWAATTARDVLGFGPVMAAIAAGAFLPAFLAAGLVARRLPGGRAAVFALAGMAGLWAAFTLMGFFTPMPTLVAAVRGAPGLLAMCATGLLGGLLFAAVSRPAGPCSRPRLGWRQPA